MPGAIVSYGWQANQGMWAAGPKDAFNAGFGWMRGWSQDAANDLTAAGRGMGCLQGVDENRAKNAIRHAYWSAIMALRLGQDTAREIEFTHEYLGSDGYYDTLVDFHNNQVGADIASEILNGQSNVNGLQGWYAYISDRIPFLGYTSNFWYDIDKQIRSKILAALCGGKLSFTFDGSDITSTGTDEYIDMQIFSDLTGITSNNNLK
jgi:hypothetical protein